MTTAAREVLKDCEIALDMLEYEEDQMRWRILWVGALALVRAVGHVLKKVDGSDPVIRPHIESRYQAWKSNREANSIFWEFIEKERNNILKEYRFNMHPLEAVDVLVTMSNQHPETGQETQIDELFTLGGNLFRPILDSHGEGEDARDIYREALRWWNAELSAIEGLISRQSEKNG